MPVILILFGIILVTAAVRNTQDELFRLVQGDFIGPNNFIYWILAILIIGSLGYVPRLRPVSTMFMALVIVVLFLTRGKGFFDQFVSQISSATATAPSKGPSLGELNDAIISLGGTPVSQVPIRIPR